MTTRIVNGVKRRNADIWQRDSVGRVTEAYFQEQVVELAEVLGWSWVHFRPGRTAHGWRTPVSGPLGKGFVDLIMLRERVIFVELKGDKGKVGPEQAAVIHALQEAGAEAHIWRPADWDTVVAVLSRRDA